ncbi:MAG: sigma-54 factor interaction domain-containing protein [Gemmatimonadetes bacterium]|nr:sigma-54 factor interaction domain-containing protein [Gemmatimonadota bacterium]
MTNGPAPAVLVGESRGMVLVRRFLARAATVDAPVLVLGETGTGKSLFARVLHGAGARAQSPFVLVSCAAVPEALFESELFGHRRGAFTGALEDRTGLLESAHRGTLLLDEVAELPPAQQAKLLTAIEEGEVRPVGGRRTVRVDARLRRNVRRGDRGAGSVQAGRRTGPAAARSRGRVVHDGGEDRDLRRGRLLHLHGGSQPRPRAHHGLVAATAWARARRHLAFHSARESVLSSPSAPGQPRVSSKARAPETLHTRALIS